MHAIKNEDVISYANLCTSFKWCATCFRFYKKKCIEGGVVTESPIEINYLIITYYYILPSIEWD